MSIITENRLKLSQLRALVAVAETSNFSEAALKLEISQSAVSHAIAHLEDELGVSLIFRGRQGAIPTPVGETIVAYARQILLTLEQIVEEANRAKRLDGGQVRVGAFRSLATHILPGAIARLQYHCPQVTIALTEFDDREPLKQALLNGQVDLAVAEILAGDEFESWAILEDEYIALLPPQSRVKGSQLNWEQLAAFPLIIPAAGSCCDRIRRSLKTAPVPTNIAYTIREDSTSIGMVVQGLGAAILPRLAAEPIPAQIQVYSLPSPLSRTLGATLLKNTLHPPIVYAFLEALRNTGRFQNVA